MDWKETLQRPYSNKWDRIHSYDLLRGFFIFLALWQHFCFYLNVWYADYFREFSVLNQTYSVHKSMIGQVLPLDKFTYFIAWFFTPWVSQIYLTLAAFNLSRKNEVDFASVYNGKMKIYFMIWIFFTFENFMVAPNFGEALSFYPIMAWMVILGLIATLYRYFGVKAIWAVFILSFTRWVLPDLTFLHHLLQWAKIHIHESYEFDAQIDYFISSGCMGFLMGYYYHHREWGLSREVKLIGMGLILIIIWLLFGEANQMNVYNIFDTEHMMAETFFGTLCILGTQLIILPSFLALEKSLDKPIRLPLFNYVGVESLSIFALHRILFMFFFAPIMMFIGTLLGKPLINTWWVAWTLSGLVFLFNYGIKRSRMLQLILGTS